MARRAHPPPASIVRSRRGDWAVADDDGVRIIGRTASAVVRDLAPGAYIVRDRDAAIALVEAAAWWAAAKGAPLPDVRLRAAGGTLTIAAATVGAALLVDGSLAVADADAALAPAGEHVPAAAIAGQADAKEAAIAHRELAQAWRQEVIDLGFERPKLAAGSTAATLLPPAWGAAMTYHWQHDADALAGIVAARYGGRVECLAPGWHGEAVEHDIRSAYGAAMAGRLGPLPGPSLRDSGSLRDPLPEEPAWLDVEVAVLADVAPLPRRDPACPWRLRWPREGSWRSWYCWHELQQPGVRIIKVHRVLRGRWDHSLERPVEALLAQRESAGGWRRAVVRQLLVSLSGRLGQAGDAWRLWAPADGSRAPLPPGLVPLGGLQASIGAYPVVEPPPAAACPQAHSYLTARVRLALARALRDNPAALYCDTDSVHLPAGVEPVLDQGELPGQWAAKVSGNAYYRGVRSYTIGSKVVGKPRQAGA